MAGKHAKPEPEFTPSSLSLNGECDRCPSRAKVRVIMPNEYLLDFCMHHYREHSEALEDQRAVVIMEQE